MTEPVVEPAVVVDRADRAILRLVWVVAGAFVVLAGAFVVVSVAFFRSSDAQRKLRDTVVTQGEALDAVSRVLDGELDRDADELEQVRLTRALLQAFADLETADDPAAVEAAQERIRRLSAEAEQREREEAARQQVEREQQREENRVDAGPTTSTTRPPTATTTTTTTTRPVVAVDPPTVTVTIPDVVPIAVRPVALLRYGAS